MRVRPSIARISAVNIASVRSFLFCLCVTSAVYGVAAERVDTAAGFDAALDKALARTDGPTLLEVMVKA